MQNIPFDEALDVASTATRALRPCLEALEAIAGLEGSCPLASEMALGALREAKRVMCSEEELERAAMHYQGVLSDAMLDRALGEGRV